MSRFNVKQGFVRILLIVSYSIGIISAFHYNFNVYTENPLIATLWCIGVLPVVIFFAVYLSALILTVLFKWIKSGFTNILIVGFIFSTSWTMAADLTPEAKEYYLNVVMPSLPTPDMHEEFLERFRKSPHSDPMKALQSAYENTLSDRWHRAFYHNHFYILILTGISITGLLLIGYIVTRFC